MLISDSGKNVTQAMRRLCQDSAMAAMTTASKATVMVLRASVRTAIWTDMAPSWAKVVATAAAASKGMNIGNLSGLVVGEMKKRPGHEDVVLDGEVEGAWWWRMTFQSTEFLVFRRSLFPAS